MSLRRLPGDLLQAQAATSVTEDQEKRTLEADVESNRGPPPADAFGKRAALGLFSVI
jgi:hypothetical protein